MSEQHDAFHDRGRRAVLAREEIWEEPPHPSSPRWGMSLVLRPDHATAQRLATTEPLADGAALVDWVEERRRLDLGVFEARSLDLVRYEYDGARTAPVALCSIPLEG